MFVRAPHLPRIQRSRQRPGRLGSLEARTGEPKSRSVLRQRLATRQAPCRSDSRPRSRGWCRSGGRRAAQRAEAARRSQASRSGAAREPPAPPGSCPAAQPQKAPSPGPRFRRVDRMYLMRSDHGVGSRGFPGVSRPFPCAGRRSRPSRGRVSAPRQNDGDPQVAAPGARASRVPPAAPPVERSLPEPRQPPTPRHPRSARSAVAATWGSPSILGVTEMCWWPRRGGALARPPHPASGMACSAEDQRFWRRNCQS